MSRVWFTSDSHFGHKNVLLYCGRPYFTIKQMNEALIKEWNKVVAPEDVVYHLGDFSFSMKAHKRYVHRLNGKKILILGNHDMGHPCRREKLERYRKQYLEAGWDDVLLDATIADLDGNTYHLSHFPVKGGGDWGEERYGEYRLPANTERVLCGHIHDMWLKKGNCLNVGVDCHDMKPISFDRVMQLFQTKGDISAPNRYRRKAFKLIHSVLNSVQGKRPTKRR